MTGKHTRAILFNFCVDVPLKGGNIETLLKEGDQEASCFFTEFMELCKTKNLTNEQQERKKQIIAVLQEKIAMMKARKEAEKRRREEIAIEELAGTQLSLFPAGAYFYQKQKSTPRRAF